MGLKKGAKINRDSALREEILEILFCSPDFLSVAEVRDEILKESENLLANCKDRASKTNCVRMCLLRLEKNQKINSKIVKSKKIAQTRKQKTHVHSVKKFK